MGIILLTQDHNQSEDLCKDLHNDLRNDLHKDLHNDLRKDFHSMNPFDPIEKPRDRIWMQETREQSHQLRPYPAYV